MKCPECNADINERYCVNCGFCFDDIKMRKNMILKTRHEIRVLSRIEKILFVIAAIFFLLSFIIGKYGYVTYNTNNMPKTTYSEGGKA